VIKSLNSIPGLADSAESGHEHSSSVKQPTGPFTIVLTGGIASGKTAVSDCFARLGVTVIDTDVIARKIVEPGRPALSQIVEGFGADFLDSDGRLDRRRMRDAIFSNPEQKNRLEAILHPLIARDVTRQIDQLAAPYCILVIPLYADSTHYSWTDRVLVVDVNEDTQLERVIARDKITPEQAHAILDAQASRQERLALADDVLDNSGTLSDLEAKVRALHGKYLNLAQ
jgi:dephospho-CoA kinase